MVPATLRTSVLATLAAAAFALTLMSHHNGVAEQQNKDRTGAPGSHSQALTMPPPTTASVHVLHMQACIRDPDMWSSKKALPKRYGGMLLTGHR